MPASNSNWVCFDCRTAHRYPKLIARVPKCLSCGDDCYGLGSKVEVPKKDDVKAWKLLREECRRRLHACQARVKRSRVRRQHHLEQEIARMEALVSNRDRTRQIRKLKDQLAALGKL